MAFCALFVRLLHFLLVQPTLQSTSISTLIVIKLHRHVHLDMCIWACASGHVYLGIPSGRWTMAIGLLMSVVVGWLVGGLCNWLADHLPHLPERPLHFDPARYLAALIAPWRAHHAHDDASARPWRNTLLLVTMAMAFGVGWWRFGGNTVTLLVGWFYTAWLLLVFVIDFEHRRVLNRMLPPAVVVPLLGALLALLGWAALPEFGSVLLGGAAGFATFLVVFVIGRGRMMGAGDVKLAGVIGLMVGYPWVWAALASGIFLGGIAAIVLLIRRRAARTYMAYGPYLAMGALLVLWIYWP